MFGDKLLIKKAMNEIVTNMRRGTVFFLSKKDLIRENFEVNRDK